MAGPHEADLVLDGFAGPGGWSEGLRMLGLRDVGLEWDAAACKTRAAAGHLTIRCDIAQYPTAPFKGRVRGGIFSPPCQAWSLTGNGLGIVDQPLVHHAVHDLAHGRDTRSELRAACKDERSILAAEPMRWLYDLRPEWVCMEEVPNVLPLWRQYGGVLRGWGYSVWYGVLNAADYGVSQTRRRALFMASRVRAVTAPEPTHSEDGDALTLYGPARNAWVSMGEVLPGRPAFTVISNYGTGGDPKARGQRRSDQPSATVTSKIDRFRLLDDEGRELPRFTHAEAGALQSFPLSYPWSGSDIALQIGNAVPPLLAAHVVSAASGVPFRQEALTAAA